MSEQQSVQKTGGKQEVVFLTFGLGWELESQLHNTGNLPRSYMALFSLAAQWAGLFTLNCKLLLHGWFRNPAGQSRTVWMLHIQFMEETRVKMFY